MGRRGVFLEKRTCLDDLDPWLCPLDRLWILGSLHASQAASTPNQDTQE